MKIIAHFKKGNARHDMTKVKRSIVVSIIQTIDGQDTTILSLPARLVKDQVNAICRLEELGYRGIKVEAAVMKHMPSNFLAYLHENQLGIITTLVRMLAKIEEFETENPV